MKLDVTWLEYRTIACALSNGQYWANRDLRDMPKDWVNRETTKRYRNDIKAVRKKILEQMRAQHETVVAERKIEMRNRKRT